MFFVSSKYQRYLFKILLTLFIIIDLSLAVIYKNNFKVATKTNQNLDVELSEIPKHTQSFAELEKYFKDMAESKGAEYAFKVLKEANTPPGTDMHLLGHVVGDVLYKQQGAQGIKICTQDFRNACSHTIVVGLFFDKGEGALSDIAQACREAPGGSGAYTMCFHGLGHGILAYTGYDLEKAIPICKKTGTSQYRNREYIECVGGTVMEIIGGGFHDRELWEKQSKKYLSDSPLAPCSSDFMPNEVRPQCYTYLTPHLFQFAGSDLSNPTEDQFQKAFTFCNQISKLDSVNRNACYGGFGKEFVVLAQNRDIRRIDQINDEQLARVYKWCHLADNKTGILACLMDVVNNLYWGGENDYHAAVRFCKQMTSLDEQTSCFDNIIEAVDYYVKDYNYRKTFCADIPDSYQPSCIKKLSNISNKAHYYG